MHAHGLVSLRTLQWTHNARCHDDKCILGIFLSGRKVVSLHSHQAAIIMYIPRVVSRFVKIVWDDAYTKSFGKVMKSSWHVSHPCKLQLYTQCLDSLNVLLALIPLVDSWSHVVKQKLMIAWGTVNIFLRRPLEVYVDTSQRHWSNLQNFGRCLRV